MTYVKKRSLITYRISWITRQQHTNGTYNFISFLSSLLRSKFGSLLSLFALLLTLSLKLLQGLFGQRLTILTYSEQISPRPSVLRIESTYPKMTSSAGAGAGVAGGVASGGSSGLIPSGIVLIFGINHSVVNRLNDAMSKQ
ncbi:hypothetical protein V1520DRAFT_138205 [Lipomyces starkeyi]